MKHSAVPPAVQVAEVARAAREIHRLAELEEAVALGQLVVDNLVDHAPCGVTHDSTSDVPLRSLAAHPELPLSAAELDETLGIFAAVEALGGLGACQHIGAAHVREALQLPLHRQVALLRRAEQLCWSEQELAYAVGQDGREWLAATAAEAPRSAA